MPFGRVISAVTFPLPLRSTLYVPIGEMCRCQVIARFGADDNSTKTDSRLVVHLSRCVARTVLIGGEANPFQF